MKRLSKILVAVLALCLLVGALALAISANPNIEGNFVVRGTGYETWEEALSAADNTHTIYLNEDWAIESEIAISGADTKIKINLNGKAINVAGDIEALFVVNGGASFTLTGAGTINEAMSVVRASGAAHVTLDATGDGITVRNRLSDLSSRYILHLLAQ